MIVCIFIRNLKHYNVLFENWNQRGVRSNGNGVFLEKRERGLIKYFLLVLAMPVAFVSCRDQKHEPREVERSFYYWRSIYKLNGTEQFTLEKLQVRSLYVKFFDVDWDPAAGQPLPKAMIRFSDKPSLPLVPVVFITNECLQQTDSLQIPALAQKIHSLINDILQSHGIAPVREVQIDCDWSATTRDKYFSLLSIIKKSGNIMVSATIRLYQVKYRTKAGVPPVDKGLLMCYNMGNLKDIRSNNSIIEKDELLKFTGKLNEYPLPLDVALPVFSWKVWFRNGAYHGITEEFPDSLLNGPCFEREANRYTAKYDTVLAGYEFHKSDLLRLEESKPADVSAVAGIISAQLKNTQTRVALYHLDSLLLSKYSYHELESFYNGLY